MPDFRLEAVIAPSLRLARVSADAVACQNASFLMAGQRSKVQKDIRFHNLRLLVETPELSQRELADAAGVSTGSANHMLKALVGKGFVKLGNFKAAEDKRRYAYLLTPKGVAEIEALKPDFERDA